MTFDLHSTLDMLRLFPEGIVRTIVSHPSLGAYCVQFLLFAPIHAAYGILQAYSAVSIGQSCGRHKLLASIGIYIGMNFAVSFLSQVVAIPVTISMLSAAGTGIRILQDTLALNAALSALLTAGLLAAQFFLCRYFLKKKLNLS